MPTPSIIQALSLTFLRERQKVSVTELAQRCGVNPNTVYGWAMKNRGMGADDIRCVAAALKLTDVDELALLRWAAEPKRPEITSG